MQGAKFATETREAHHHRDARVIIRGEATRAHLGCTEKDKGVVGNQKENIKQVATSRRKDAKELEMMRGQELEASEATVANKKKCRPGWVHSREECRQR
jgi:hypothetical protein